MAYISVFTSLNETCEDRLVKKSEHLAKYYRNKTSLKILSQLPELTI